MIVCGFLVVLPLCDVMLSYVGCGLSLWLSCTDAIEEGYNNTFEPSDSDLPLILRL